MTYLVEKVREQWTAGRADKRFAVGISRVNTSRKMPHNKALQLTANPLRGLSSAELGRYASMRRRELARA